MKKLESLENCGDYRSADSEISPNISAATNSPISTSIKSKNQVFCSICSWAIDDYIPEYFCGEKFNPACETCKARDSSWASDDSFSSFLSNSQPVSMASHWLILYERDIKPSPMPYFVAHYVGHPYDKKPVSKEEYLALFQEFREQIRADSARIIAKMREDFKS